MENYRYRNKKQIFLLILSGVITFLLVLACYGILRKQWLDDYTAKGASLVLGYVVWDILAKTLGIKTSTSASKRN